MRRTALYVVAWFAAGLAAVALATAGVSMVGNQVTGSRPSPLSAAEVAAELAADDATPTSTTTTAPGPGTTPTTAPGTATTGGATGAPAGGGPTTTTGPGVTTSTTPSAPATAPPATAPPAAAETRTYTLTGGTATLRFAATGVTVVVASPNPGYSVDVEGTHDNGVRVEFRSDAHRSRVEGWWDEGPRDQTEEQD